MNDNYTAPSGGSIYAGMAAPATVPSWIANKPVNTWGIVPMGNTIADVDAEDMPDLNPNFPSNAPWRGTGGIASIISKWCGQHADTLRNYLHWVFAGGHGDYGGNEHIRVNLNLPVPMYELLRPPSGSKNATYPSGFATNDGQEATGIYQDGLPRSIHDYNKPVFAPDLGLVVAVQGNCYITATGTRKSIVVNPETGEVEYFGGQWLGGQADSSGMASCYDSTRRCIWTKGAGTGRFFKRQTDDFANQPWVSVGSVSISGSSDSGMDYSSDDDVILLIRLNKAYAVNPSNGAWFDITSGIVGALVGATLNGTMQPRYIGGRKFAVWDNSSNTTKINILSWTGDPYVAANWSITQLPVAPSNSVTPTARTANGTFGRFAYFPNLGIFTLINATDQPMYFYKLAA